jgi:hypothetical protein
LPSLPTPGADSGTWGDELNEFLEVAHESDGRLKVVPFNVKDYGATWDGTTNDSAAVKAAEAALTDGSILYFPPGRYKITDTALAGFAAVHLDGLSRVAVVFAEGAELVMANLSAGSGTSHGIRVSGPCSDVAIVNARVVWSPTATVRSWGSGIRVDGGAATTLNNTDSPTRVRILNTYVENASECGLIAVGVTDLSVRDFVAKGTLADTLHVNACRRFQIDGLTGISCGDDTLGAITYYSATDTHDGSAAYGRAFGRSVWDEWSNSGVARGIVSLSSVANVVRLAGCYNTIVSGISGISPGNGISIESSNGGSFSEKWAVSKNCVISEFAILNPTTYGLLAFSSTEYSDPARFWEGNGMLVRNGTITGTGLRPFYVGEIEGVNLADIDCFGVFTLGAVQGGRRNSFRNVFAQDVALGDSATYTRQRGSTANRPTLTTVPIGHCYVDETIGRNIYKKNDTVWTDGQGSSVIATPTVASAATFTVPAGAEIVAVSGTVNITSVTAGHPNQRVTLIFQDALTFTDGSNLTLAGNFVTTGGDTISLVCDGTTWYETSRSVN